MTDMSAYSHAQKKIRDNRFCHPGSVLLHIYIKEVPQLIHNVITVCEELCI